MLCNELISCREYLALNVYVALCYYKLDYYDVSQEIVSVYLQHHPDSPVATNLKACNHFRLYNGKAAEQELRALQVCEHYYSIFPNFNIIVTLCPLYKASHYFSILIFRVRIAAVHH